MPLTFKTNGGGGDGFKSVPPGSHIAVCNLVADLGLQPGSAAYPAPKHQVYIRFEVPAERIDYTDKNGKQLNGPVVIGQAFTASMHEKATLRLRLESWRGKSFTDEQAATFDVSSVLGKPCMLNVIENVKGDKVYANIASISPLPRGIAAPKAENALLYYAEDDASDFEKLPEWIQKKIEGQLKPEPVKQLTPSDNPNDLGISDSDVPF